VPESDGATPSYVEQNEGVTPYFLVSPRLANRPARYMHCRTFMRRFGVLAILLALACGKQNDDEKLQQSVVSWKATLQLVTKARLNKEIRDRFALKTADEAVDDLKSQSAKAKSRRAEQLIGVAVQLRQAVEHDDTAALLKIERELAR
jgi:hypothetical protein